MKRFDGLLHNIGACLAEVYKEIVNTDLCNNQRERKSALCMDIAGCVIGARIRCYAGTISVGVLVFLF